MGIRDDLVQNLELATKTFLFLIDEERKRIVQANLGTSEQVEKIVSHYSKDLVRVASVNDVAKRLACIHDILQSVKLPGDICVVVYEIEQPIEPIKTKPIEIVVDEKKEEPKEEKKKEKEVEAKDLVELEKISYELGNLGEYTDTYLIERACKKLQNK